MQGAIRPKMNLQQAEEVGVGFAKSIGCNNIKDLRSKTAQEILAANQGMISPFEDGYVVPNSMYDTYLNNQQNDIPTLLGWNLDDKIMGMPLSAKDYIESIHKQYGKNADKLLEQYPGNNDAEAAVSQGDLSRDQTFGVQGYIWATMQSEKGKSPVYVYNFNRNNNINMPPK